MNKSLLFGIVAVSILLQCTDQQTELTKIKYIQSIDEWHAHRIEKLKQPDSWLSLAGLFWLHEGKNTVGCDSGNDVIFPPGEKPEIGTVILNDSTVRFIKAAGAEVTLDDSLISTVKMLSDESGQPTILKSGRFLFYMIRRGQRLAIRLKDTKHKNFTRFADISRFPVDPAWRVQAHLEPYHPPKKIAIPNVLGEVEWSECPGALVFEVDGESFRLDPILEGKSPSLFIIFSDQTSGKETYGAGRFLYADWPDSNGYTILDFNKAYNPPCVFTDFATCPLPPRQNWLGLAVTAGELSFHINTGHEE